MTMKVVSASEDYLPTSALQMTCRKCRRGRRGWRPGRLSWQNHHKVQNGDRSRQDKSVMTNNTNCFQREIKIIGYGIEEVENFKYLGAIISIEGSKPEILSRIAQTTAAFSRLKIICRDKNISLASKVKLMRTLTLSTFIYVCESWTLTAEIKRRIQALEMRCYRRLLNISYKDHVMNEEVGNRIQNARGVHDDLLTMVKKRKLRWYGHISRSWQIQFCKGQWKEQEWEEDRRRDGKITSRNGREWGLEIPWGQRKTGKDGKVLLQCHLWCPNDLQG